MRGHSKKVAACEPGWGPSQWSKGASTFILEFPDSRTVRNKCLLFKPPSLCILSFLWYLRWLRKESLPTYANWGSGTDHKSKSRDLIPMKIQTGSKFLSGCPHIFYGVVGSKEWERTPQSVWTCFFWKQQDKVNNNNHKKKKINLLIFWQRVYCVIPLTRSSKIGETKTYWTKSE